MDSEKLKDSKDLKKENETYQKLSKRYNNEKQKVIVFNKPPWIFELHNIHGNRIKYFGNHQESQSFLKEVTK